MSLFSISHLSKNYGTKAKPFFALKDVSFVLPNRGFFSIVGKSGCGKSSLLNILTTVDRPTEGVVFFKGQNLHRLSKKKKADYRLYNIGIVFQHYNLLEDSDAISNISLPLVIAGMKKKEAEEKTLSFLKEFQMEKLAFRIVNTMSGGEKQRIAILRAIANNPEVLFCDEPTGALDNKNSKLVLTMLKNISKNRLVVMVSHNLEMVNNYSDSILFLKDGSLIKSITNNTIKTINNLAIIKKKRNTTWIESISKKHFKNNRSRNLFSIIACCFGFVMSLLTIGFAINAPNALKETTYKYLNSSSFSISKKSIYAIDNSPLSLTKNSRPTIEETKNLFRSYSSINIDLDLCYFLSTYPLVNYIDEKFSDVSFLPVQTFLNHDDLYLEKSNVEDSFDNCVINREFADKIRHNEPYSSLIDREISISINKEFTYKSDDEDSSFINETFSMSKTFFIKGIVSEFVFLGTPKIYYSYYDSYTFLENNSFPLISEKEGKSINAIDVVLNSSNDSAISNYSLLFFSNNDFETESIFDMANSLSSDSADYEIFSAPLMVRNAFLSIVEVAEVAFVAFVGIALFGAFLIMGMLSFASFIEHKKESAILSCLGANDSDIKSIFIGEKLRIGLIVWIISLPLAYLFSLFANYLVSVIFGINNLIVIPFLSMFGIAFFIPIVFLVFAFLITYISTSIPLLYYKHLSISYELKDE